MLFETKFNYGDKVKDVITGCNGTVIGVAFYYDKETTRYLVSYLSSTDALNEDWIAENRLTKA